MSEKRKIITIAGDLSSGKTTVTALMQEQLGYEIYRNGEYFIKDGEELLARAICHELDHLEGILFLDLAEKVVEENLKRSKTYGLSMHL